MGFRYFEAIYARSIVVFSDLSQFEFLIPFPRDGMLEVPEGESVVPAVDRAIALYDERPAIVQSNLDYLNRWLIHGWYSRKRMEVLERFFAQLETVQPGSTVRSNAGAEMMVYRAPSSHTAG